jgi:hypothetical protein
MGEVVRNRYKLRKAVLLLTSQGNSRRRRQIIGAGDLRLAGLACMTRLRVWLYGNSRHLELHRQSTFSTSTIKRRGLPTTTAVEARLVGTA